jgi:hypothetical protein
MTNDIKTSGKKDKGFFDNILDSCLQFFESIILAVESVFKSISNAFESLFSHSSENEDFKGSNESSKAPVGLGVEKNTRETKKTARESLVELFASKPSNEDQEEERRKQHVFEEASKKGAINFVKEYVTNIGEKIDEFVASNDEEKVKKIKEYFVDKYKDGDESFDASEVSQLFDYEVVKSAIINCCKELSQQLNPFSTSLRNQDQSVAPQSSESSQISELLVFKKECSIEGGEIPEDKRCEFKRRCKVVAEGFVFGYFYVNENMREFCHFEDDVKFNKVKEYFVQTSKENNAQDSADLFDCQDLKDAIIACINNLIPKNNELDKPYTNGETVFVEEFIKHHNYQYSSETRKFSLLDKKAKQEEIQRFVQIKESSGRFNIERLLMLTELTLNFRDTSFHDDSSCEIKMGEGVVPRSSIELSSNGPLSLQERGGCGGAIFWT